MNVKIVTERRIALAMILADFLFVAIGLFARHAGFFTAFLFIHGIVPLVRGKLYVRGRILSKRWALLIAILLIPLGAVLLVLTVNFDISMY